MSTNEQDAKTDETAEAGATVPNADLEHTEGGATTRDAMDAGAPMAQGKADEPVGPEDALGDAPTRGDYSDRIHRGPSKTTREVPYEDRLKAAKKLAGRNGNPQDFLAEVPQFELVDQGAAPQAASA